jgi:hypothetical protein
LEHFLGRLWHWGLCMASGNHRLKDFPLPTLEQCEKEAYKDLVALDRLQKDKKKNPMKYIFQDMKMDIEYFCHLIESDWLKRCLSNDHIKMMQVCDELRPDLYFHYWTPDVDLLITERDLVGEIKRLSFRFMCRAINSLEQENKKIIESHRNILIDWLTSLKKIHRDGIGNNSSLILEAGLI